MAAGLAPARRATAPTESTGLRKPAAAAAQLLAVHAARALARARRSADLPVTEGV